MALQSSQRLPELLFYTKKSYWILQAPIPAPILHAEDKELFEYYYHIQRAKRPSFQKRNSTHRRQGDLLEMHLCILQKPSNDIPGIPATRPSKGTPVTPVAPETFQTFQSFMTFQPFQAILQCSSISKESTPFQHSPIRMHILQFLQFDWLPQKNSTEYQLNNYKHYILQRKGDVAISVKLTYSLE